MAILLYNNMQKDLSTWIEALKEHDNDLDIRIYPDIGNIKDITFAITWPFEKEYFNQFPNLKAICSMGAGVNHIVKDTSISSHIYILKLIDENLVNSMWEYLLSTVMYYVSNLNDYIIQQNNNIWNELKPNSISNTTIGIMGLGNIGNKVAKNFNNLGFKVKGYSNTKKYIKNISTYTSDDLDIFLQGVDILISILPLTTNTKNIFNTQFFNKMKKDSILINVGRGAQVNEDDLIQALDNNQLSSVFLDVFKKEPLEKDHPFWNHPKINITPHIASITNAKSVAKQIVQNYHKITNGKVPDNIINIQQGY